MLHCPKGRNRGLNIFCLALSTLLIQPVLAQTRCSFIKTNHDCELRLDRNSFVVPPPLQMYPGAVVTVKIENGNDYELYTLDPGPGSASPLIDIASTTVGDLNTILAAASSLAAVTAIPEPAAAAQAAPPPPPPQLEQNYALNGVPPNKALPKKVDPCEKDPNGSACRQEKDAELANAVTNALVEQRTKDKEEQAAKDQEAEEAFNNYISDENCDINHVSQFSTEACMLRLLNDASQRILRASLPSQHFYSELNTLLTPDSQPPLSSVPIPDASTQHVPFDQLLQELCGEPTAPNYYQPCGVADDHSLIHQQAAASAYAAALLARMTKPPTEVNPPSGKTYPQPSRTVLNAMQLVTEEQAALDAIRKDLEGYASRLQDLAIRPTIQAETVGYIQDSHKSHYFTRTVTFTLNRLNLVSNSQEAVNDGSKKVSIVTITAVYGDSRWEGSAGVALVFRPIRTFSVAPSISGTTPPITQSGTYISESKASPEVAPFAAANYRLGPDGKFLGWRSAIYATGGIGYNTSQESADYLAGFSLSWRGLAISPLCDFGHGARLGNSLQANDQLSTTYTASTVPTVNYWVPAFAVGISIRIPAITGR